MTTFKWAAGVGGAIEEDLEQGPDQDGDEDDAQTVDQTTSDQNPA